MGLHGAGGPVIDSLQGRPAGKQCAQDRKQFPVNSIGPALPMSDEKEMWEGGIGGRHRGRSSRREGKSAGLCALVWHLVPAGIHTNF